MLAAALVDYDNVCRTAIPEKGPTDVALNLDELIHAISSQAASIVPRLEELQVRLYGGWVDRSGRLTDRAGWLLGQLPLFRRRVNGVRIRPILVTTLSVLPERDLVATYRSDVHEGQKMVDGMLTVDSLFLATREQYPVLIVSDDDDFVPALIAAHVLAGRPTRIILMRRNKALGSSPNDSLLKGLPLIMRIC